MGQITGKTSEKKNNRSAKTRPRVGTESTTRSFALESVRVGVVGNISACHADARGSIPRHGDAIFFFFCAARVFWPQFLESVEAAAKQNDTLPEWLRGSPAK